MSTSRRRRVTALGVVVTLLLATGQDALAAGDNSYSWKLPELQQNKSVPTTSPATRGTGEDPAAKAAVTKVEQPKWPAESQTDIDLTSAAKTSSLVSVQRTDTAGAARSAAPAKVRVSVKGQDTAKKLGLHGVVFSVSDSGGASGTPLRLDVDYGSFAPAFGGDYASRLRLVSLPACALSTPDKSECRTSTPLPGGDNDSSAKRVTADLPPAPATNARRAEPEARVFAVAAAPSGGNGDYTATSLAAAGSWNAGGSSGDFTYGYPLRVPPAAGGKAPSVSLGYSSQSLDGRISASNNQASIVGDGWDVAPGGFIERQYKPCGLDLGGNNGQTKTGDQCWATDNATISLVGVSGKLVKAGESGGTSSWRAKNDDGARIERFTGAVNGDNDGEYWKVTTTDGTQHFLGVNRLPGWTSGKPETKSAWTVPVYGNNDGEPCKQGTFDASWCQQAYRWNLDYSVDPHGNVTTYYYDQEINHYGRNIDPAKGTPYVRGGYLTRIEYGLRSDNFFGAVGGRVQFDMAERCLPNGAITCDPGQLNASTAGSWPDVPADQLCNAGEQCTNRLTPTFFTRKRLTKVIAQVGNGTGGYSDVDSWTLTQDFPASGDGTSPALNLKSIVHTGHVGGAIALPATSFDRVAMANRVDSGSDNLSPLTRYRITGINGEGGARTEISYSAHDCVPGSRMPASPETNTLRCYPTWWTPDGALTPILDYFHKYVVTDVVDDDRTGASSLLKTHYDYVGNPAWRFDDNDFAEPNRRTYSQWRGYGTVRTVKGESPGTQSVSETTYLRGMDGATVTTSEGEPVTDTDRLQGFVRETRDYLNGALVSASVNDPWVSAPTATANGVQATMSNVQAVRGRTVLENGQWRRTKVVKTFDSIGVVSQVEDHGDLAVTDDESCSRTTFARNEPAWMLTYASQVETTKGLCTVTASASTILTSAKSSYDGQAWGVAPHKGDITKAEVLDKWDGSGQSWVTASTSTFDAYGRPLQVVDATGATTTTAYSPATGPLTQVTSTNALGHVSTGYFEPAWGVSTASVDPNGRRSDLSYDALGRMTAAWLPGHAKGSVNADVVFEYAYNTNAPSVVTTKKLTDANTYQISYTLYDGLFRERQTQSPSPAGGRLISDTFYDSRGLPYKSNGAYWNNQVPSSALAGVYDWEVPNQTVTEYDGLGRVTASIYRKYAVEQWRSTTSYGGDRVHTTPPQGGTVTTVISDAHGRTTEKRQYTAGLGTAFDATKYTYTPAGQLATVTDPAGNVWSSTYDLRGRKIASDDPDAGHSSTAYDAAGRVTSTTDARGRTIAHTYDALSRKTASYDGTTSGTKLAEWQYDTSVTSSGVLNGRGLLTLSRRWVNGQAYTTKVNGYDAAGRPTGQKVIVPAAAEGVLGTTYGLSFSYSYTGKLRDLVYEAANSGGRTIVPSEGVTTGYNSFGLAEYTLGASRYISSTTYSALGEVLQERYDDEFSPNNLWVTNFYQEGTRRLERTVADRETQTGYRIADRNYSYDAAGNINRIADTPDGGASDIQCFGYDQLRRMTNAWTPGSGDCSAPKSTSSLGGAAPYWLSWTFDKTGNRLTQTAHATAGDTTNSFTYPAAGQPQPHTVTKVDTAGPNGTAQDTFGYDASGNTTSRRISGDTQILEYDVEGRVSKVVNANGQESTYLYDADGGRLIAREPSATTLYVFGQEIRLEKNTTTPSWTRYYSHNGHVVAQRNSISGVKWLLTDHQGTQIAAVTQGNLAVASRRQTPFGETRGSTAVPWNTQGFVGGTQEESGLTRVGARLYDATVGRFLSADPVIDNNDPQQLNGYAYSNNSPVTFSDPTGLLAGGQCGPDGILCGGGRENYQNEQQYRDVQTFFKEERRAQQQQTRAVRQATQKAMQDAGISQAEYEQALKNAHKTKWDVIKEVAWEMLKDISGWNDIVDCFTKGDIWACGGLVMNLVPWGKIGKVIEAGYKAVKAVASMANIISKAQGLLRRVEGIAARAQEIAINALRKVGGKTPDCDNSFMPGTKVMLADGSAKPIEEIQNGDQVLATDEKTGESSPREVVGTIVGVGSKNLVEITVDGGGAVTATDTHPFWLPEQKKWVYAKALEAGSILQTSAGTWVQVSAVRAWTAPERVHNLTVDNEHTYYVTAGAVSLLNHNCGVNGLATLHYHGKDNHFSIEVTDGTTVRHTDLDRRGDTAVIGTRDDAGIMSVQFELTDVAAALEVQKYQGAAGKYDKYTNSCLTYCATVLRAGGVDIPQNGVTRWARELFKNGT
ncbi:intein N-terminal splicing region/RHS repeat-associated core domain-containing protein [Lentzea fradiae]|uniref:Intein N-terminal splicing region/RHS repeat-associated core domain-containing protein n=1 Tax=Lentzea fradiae TaxID=200378 RepID=A0A1G8DNR8_9PSEU|nr:polymorphic toxin-type HINT domain-containing protein [Lentzea fradiae]SDH59179.1 intein N-terminal splicing region/RHS repeat-associated core domain-containing protein [Lentzea fradiae]